MHEHINLMQGDCLQTMKTLADNSVDAIVSDPPYGISFMAKKWDYDVPSVEVWQEAMRVLKPGGHALIACGTRTQHRMVVNIEDAGFEIRDVVSWIYGSGFPKSLNISKAIDRAAGVEREVVGHKKREGGQTGMTSAKGWNPSNMGNEPKMTPITAPATDAAKQWDGFGTALKPACEFFTLCRKPLSEKTIAANVLRWGTGGINIDGCRVEASDKIELTTRNTSSCGDGWKRPWMDDKEKDATRQAIAIEKANTMGRFPANLIHDGSPEVLELFPETKPSKAAKRGLQHSDNGGSAARFFYCAKASKKDRNEGLPTGETSSHPTVKPTALMQYLCRLITPPGGVVLDPYMGSGSTGKAAIKEGFGFVGCELDPDYFEIAKTRIEFEDLI